MKTILVSQDQNVHTGLLIVFTRRFFWPYLGCLFLLLWGASIFELSFLATIVGTDYADAVWQVFLPVSRAVACLGFGAVTIFSRSLTPRFFTTNALAFLVVIASSLAVPAIL